MCKGSQDKLHLLIGNTVTAEDAVKYFTTTLNKKKYMGSSLIVWRQHPVVGN